MDPRLHPYIVTLESGQTYRFWAENEDHAREQAVNAEPDNPMESVEPELPPLPDDFDPADAQKKGY